MPVTPTGGAGTRQAQGSLRLPATTLKYFVREAGDGHGASGPRTLFPQDERYSEKKISRRDEEAKTKWNLYYFTLYKKYHRAPPRSS